MGVSLRTATVKDGSTRLTITVRNAMNLSGTMTVMRMRNEITVVLDSLDLRTMQTNRVTLTLMLNGVCCPTEKAACGQI